MSRLAWRFVAVTAAAAWASPALAQGFGTTEEPAGGTLMRWFTDSDHVSVRSMSGDYAWPLKNAAFSIHFNNERVVILEDTRELKCAAQDCVTLRTKPGVASLSDLVRSTLRLRPDRIVVGEVRGPEALDMLKAWNTGHPGGITTLHANSAAAALVRLEQLVQEAVVTVPRALIAEAVDVLVFINGRGAARRVESLLELDGLDDDGAYVLKSMGVPVLRPVAS